MDLEVAPKMTKQHEEIRDEVIKSRKELLAAIAKLERAFNLNHTRKRP